MVFAYAPGMYTSKSPVHPMPSEFLNPARGTRGMAVAPHALAAQSALAILREGGNAVEAMISAAATIAVVYPHMNSIGGDGFWLISSRRRACRYRSLRCGGIGGECRRVPLARTLGHTDAGPARSQHGGRHGVRLAARASLVG